MKQTIAGMRLYLIKDNTWKYAQKKSASNNQYEVHSSKCILKSLGKLVLIKLAYAASNF